jgi:hypothetical protein
MNSHISCSNTHLSTLMMPGIQNMHYAPQTFAETRILKVSKT